MKTILDQIKVLCKKYNVSFRIDVSNEGVTRVDVMGDLNEEDMERAHDEITGVLWASLS